MCGFELKQRTVETKIVLLCALAVWYLYLDGTFGAPLQFDGMDAVMHHDIADFPEDDVVVVQSEPGGQFGRAVLGTTFKYFVETASKAFDTWIKKTALVTLNIDVPIGTTPAMYECVFWIEPILRTAVPRVVVESMVRMFYRSSEFIVVDNNSFPGFRVDKDGANRSTIARRTNPFVQGYLKDVLDEIEPHNAPFYYYGRYLNGSYVTDDRRIIDCEDPFALEACLARMSAFLTFAKVEQLLILYDVDVVGLEFIENITQDCIAINEYTAMRSFTFTKDIVFTLLENQYHFDWTAAARAPLTTFGTGPSYFDEVISFLPSAACSLPRAIALIKFLQAERVAKLWTTAEVFKMVIAATKKILVDGVVKSAIVDHAARPIWQNYVTVIFADDAFDLAAELDTLAIAVIFRKLCARTMRSAAIGFMRSSRLLDTQRVAIASNLAWGSLEQENLILIKLLIETANADSMSLVARAIRDAFSVSDRLVTLWMRFSDENQITFVTEYLKLVSVSDLTLFINSIVRNASNSFWTIKHTTVAREIVRLMFSTSRVLSTRFLPLAVFFNSKPFLEVVLTVMVHLFGLTVSVAMLKEAVTELPYTGSVYQSSAVVQLNTMLGSLTDPNAIAVATALGLGFGLAQTVELPETSADQPQPPTVPSQSGSGSESSGSSD